MLRVVVVHGEYIVGVKYEVNTISCSDYAYIHSHHIAPNLQGTNGLAFTGP